MNALNQIKKAIAALNIRREALSDGNLAEALEAPEATKAMSVRALEEIKVLYKDYSFESAHSRALEELIATSVDCINDCPESQDGTFIFTLRDGSTRSVENPSGVYFATHYAAYTDSHCYRFTPDERDYMRYEIRGALRTADPISTGDERLVAEVICCYEDTFELGKFASDEAAINAAAQLQRSADRCAMGLLEDYGHSGELAGGPCYVNAMYREDTAIDDDGDEVTSFVKVEA